MVDTALDTERLTGGLEVVVPDGDCMACGLEVTLVADLERLRTDCKAAIRSESMLSVS